MEARLLSTDDEVLADEIIRQGEVRLAAQLQLAIAADQRAMSLAASSSAVAAASFGIGASQATSDQTVFATLIVVGIGFSVTSALAAWSARPTPFSPQGLSLKSSSLIWIPLKLVSR